MGGQGSGRTAGLGLLTAKTSDYHSIDLAWLGRNRLLRPGTSGTLRWSRGGRETGSVQYRIEVTSLVLVYRARRNGDDWQSITDSIPFVRTPTQFGSGRPWLCCPACRRRCRIVYGGTYFRRRRCLGLKYETQYEPAFARAATRALKIRERLGDDGGVDDPPPRKPMGMHRRTYDRLLAELERLERGWLMGLAGKWGFLDPAA